MRIIHIMPGYVQNYYCENCLRDDVLVHALSRLGHDVIVVPLYMPLREEEMAAVKTSRIFYGGINVYLQQKSALFRHTPRAVDRLLDATGLLRWATRRNSMTKAAELGELTLSTLNGTDGRQVKELQQLVDWLASQEKPDVIGLSNALLLGLAGPIRERVGVPVVCFLQDEDDFLDALPTPWSERNWRKMQELTQQVDLFVAGSDYYAKKMQERLDIPAAKLATVYYGIETDRYAEPEPSDVPTIGFLSQVRIEKGFDTLVEAFRLLKQKPEHKSLRLIAAGDRIPEQSHYVQEIERTLHAERIADDVTFLHEFDRPTRIDFLRRLSVLSVPERHGDASAMYVLEALACGVPVVQPRRGVFPEWLGLTGGGVLVEPEDPSALAAELEKMLTDQAQARKYGQAGRIAVRKHFDAKICAERLAQVIQKRLLSERRANNHDRSLVTET